MMKSNNVLVGAALSLGVMMPVGEVEAATQRYCIDVNGGAIGPEDNLPVIEIQRAVGAYPDGKFGQATCNAVWAELIKDGHLTGNGTNLKIGDTVLGWLGVGESASAPTPTAPSNDKECKYSVISSKETARLLDKPNKSGKDLCAIVVAFQKDNKLAADGIVGPVTAKKMITKSANACAIYGAAVNDCFLGLQESGRLGTLYTIVDGKVVRSMPSRFGNPNLPNGESTPEGTFPINRAIKGPRAGSNCKKVNGVT